ncbi:IS1096 element passenger TnpR family protein [Joostella sp. CR20]|uniref:IS1096 element passenger TnpR family protein n=1 Tax=Joostella sp. CR20 TaxID=2804312 RepID=UPI00313A8855
MIYKFRIILDLEEDVFRDIEVEGNSTLEDFHNAVSQAFGFDGTEMASFYESDEEWTQGEEFALFDMSETGSDVRLMSETYIEDILDENHRNLIYVYDFFSMWTFFVELADIAEKEDGKSYPNLMYVHGQLPDAPPVKKFEAEDLSENMEDEDDFDIDSYDDFDFDEHWN